jgi:hypothetical protein
MISITCLSKRPLALLKVQRNTRLIGETIEQSGCRLPQYRMNDPGIDLDEWSEHKAPLVHSWVGERQLDPVTAPLDMPIIEQEQININSPWTKGKTTLPAEFKFGLEAEAH